MPSELPPLDKFVVSGYSENTPSYPIVVVVKDNRANGYTPPTILDACPDDRFTSHRFIGITPTNLDNRVIWTYELLPGPTLVSSKYEPDSDTVITTSKTRKVLSTIAEGVAQVTIGPTDYVQTTDSEPIDTVIAWEIVQLQPKPVAVDDSTAVTLSNEPEPIKMPAILDFSTFVGTSGLIGFRRAFVRIVQKTTKAYWVYGSEPTLTLTGRPILVSVNDITNPLEEFSEVITNGGDLVYTSGITVTYPASTPNLTTYISGWITSSQRSIRGRVTQDKSKYRWRVEKDFIQFEMQAIPTYSTPP